MPHISQHEAAELWEIARDHFTTGAKLSSSASTFKTPSSARCWSNIPAASCRSGSKSQVLSAKTARAFRAITLKEVLQSSQQFAQFQSRALVWPTIQWVARLSSRGPRASTSCSGEGLKDCKHLVVSAKGRYGSRRSRPGTLFTSWPANTCRWRTSITGGRSNGASTPRLKPIIRPPAITAKSCARSRKQDSRSAMTGGQTQQLFGQSAPRHPALSAAGTAHPGSSTALTRIDADIVLELRHDRF